MRSIVTALLVACAVLAPAAAMAVQPDVNPSTIARDIPRFERTYVDTTFILASGDSTRWAFGFEAPKVEVWTYSKGVYCRYIGPETYVAVGTREGLKKGYRKGRPRFSSVEFWMPANTTDGIEAFGTWGLKLRSVLAADTVYVRAYVPAWVSR